MIKLALLATLAAAAMPMLASAQPLNGTRVPITDKERAASTHRELIGLRPLSKRASPIAYGYVYTDGAQASSSGNIKTSYNSTYGWYVVQISGLDYYYSSFSTTITPSVPENATCVSDSVDGTLLVQCFDPAGDPVQADFGFITF